ncbi:uncharacterized protein N7511_011503 [Penicillium nucicola]|uniref:uncharacterized protein n=1 Tax=Penicillium nucicola TaxID=1850975 RepID=UPI00254506C6|nr:uncharacterized protein N7511_011503 [Penicillium nucicola]KAJ5742484.1 hypothetical protein N7511_011503 [Penicillium nucicola]
MKKHRIEYSKRGRFQEKYYIDRIGFFDSRSSRPNRSRLVLHILVIGKYIGVNVPKQEAGDLGHQKTLIQFHGSKIQENQGFSDDPYSLEILWHSEFI